jgi:cbb3-type cytochrome oxidase subunit 3
MNELHAIVTVVLFVLFVGIIAFTFSKGQKEKMDAAARIPLEDDTPPSSSSR